MLQHPVELQITRATLDVLAREHRSTPDEVWQVFRAWNAERGREVDLSFEERPPFYDVLQDLYAFAFETCDRLELDEFLKLAGQRFNEIILKEQLPELLDVSTPAVDDIAGAMARLYTTFIQRYSQGLFRGATEVEGCRLTCKVQYTDPEATGRHLAKCGKDPQRSFRNIFVFIVATGQACMTHLLKPWSDEHLELDIASGTFVITFPEETRFNYPRLVATLAAHTKQLQQLHAEQRFALVLEHDLIHESPLMQDTWDQIKRASGTDELILLRGEPGTGKTHLAARIHEISARKDEAFVEVALTADIGLESLVQSHLFGHVKGAFTSAHENKVGLFQLADRGTIFLDEIGDATPDMQAKLLRVIEKRTFKPLGSTGDVTVDVRILAATNRDLEGMVQEGSFRADLYHRLNVIQISLPPLRERAKEIPLLCEHFVRRAAAEIKKPPKPLSKEVQAYLKRYQWPGNIRELIHVLKRALLFSEQPQIEMGDLPDHVRAVEMPPPAAAAPAPVSVRDEVIDYARLRELLESSDGTPVAERDTASCPWHIDFAKRTYLRALIDHCDGNLRRITTFWDRKSERAVRGLIEKYDLRDALESARRRRS